MSNQHREMPGSGVLFWEDENMRRSDKAPDYKGFVLLEHDYKAGEKLKLGGWVKQTSVGKTLISLREDAWQIWVVRRVAAHAHVVVVAGRHYPRLQ